MAYSQHHSFDIKLASIYGIDEAIMIHHLQYWISHNRRLKKNFHYERTWSYQTLDDIAGYFPYWTKDKVYEILQRLITGKNRKSKKDDVDFEPVLMVENFNKNTFDRTRWYAFIDEKTFLDDGLADLGNPKMEVGKSQNPSREIPTTIPDTKTNAKPEQQTQPPKKSASESSFVVVFHELSMEDQAKVLEAQKLGVLNQACLSTILKYSVSQIKQAVEAVNCYKERQLRKGDRIESIEATLIKALKDEWRPNYTKENLDELKEQQQKQLHGIIQERHLTAQQMLENITGLKDGYSVKLHALNVDIRNPRGGVALSLSDDNTLQQLKEFLHEYKIT